MKSLRPHFVKALTLFLIALSICLIDNALCFGNSYEASSAIKEAEDALEQAFLAVLEAEMVGANVSVLMVKLSDAGGLLAEAEMAYRVGNFSEVIRKAEQCFRLVEGVAVEALSLKSRALVDAHRVFMQTVSFSLVGAIMFFVALFFVWSWFKRYYIKKLLKMKPEAAADAEA